MNDYDVTFIMDYFSIYTTISADDADQAERLAEEWLSENGLDISKFKILDINIIKQGEWEE
jgi:hypothetical protein